MTKLEGVIKYLEFKGFMLHEAFEAQETIYLHSRYYILHSIKENLEKYFQCEFAITTFQDEMDNTYMRHIHHIQEWKYFDVDKEKWVG